MNLKWGMGKKLMAGTGLLFVLAMVLSIVGLLSLRNFKRGFDDASDITFRKLVLANGMVTANSEMISTQRGIILAAFGKNQTELETYKNTFAENVEIVRKAIEEIRPLLRTDEGKKLTSDIEAAEAEWTPHYNEVVAKAAAGDVTEANRIRSQVTAPLYKKIGKTAVRLAAQQSELMAEQKKRLASEYSRSVWLSMLLLVGFFGLSFVVVMVVRQTTRQVREAATQLAQAAEQVGSAAAQVSSSSQALAQGASEQAASLEETSASTEEINSMARQNSTRSHSTTELVDASQEQFARTSELLSGMLGSMNEIQASSEKVSKIIKVIDEIAFQTNILALNAAVEAARAGDAGLGFAVVADEVRSLAQRCAQAAKDTTNLIAESVEKSNEGQAKVSDVSAAIRSAVEGSKNIKILVTEVKVGSEEQARGLDQVSRAVAQMGQVTQSTAAAAEETASASEELTSLSAALRDVVGGLVVMVEGERAAA